MCDVGLLTGFDEIILDPDYRRPDLVAPVQHYFQFDGGDLEMPIEVARGNTLQVELLDSSGRVVEHEAWRASDATGPSMRAADLAGGIYALRFSGYGNGTQIRVEAPAP
jgi:hypothetical protein